jgi:hypothetical protein
MTPNAPLASDSPRSNTLRSLAPVASLLVAALLAACGGTVEGTGGTGGSECEGADCIQCAAMPTCPSGEVEVDTCPMGATCSEVTECGATILCVPEAQCAAVPVCPEGTSEVAECPEGATCTEATMCGTTILCLSDVNCEAYPSCDPGDTEVPDGACFDGMVCYQASLCGTTIVCDDKALPQHGCPLDEPVAGDACSGEPAVCSYTTTPDCFRDYVCDASTGAWIVGGEACAGNPGNG